MNTLASPLHTSGRCCSDLRLDRFLVDELDDADRTVLEAHLATSVPCRARLDALRADRAAFVADLQTASASTKRPSSSPSSPSSSSSSSSSSSPSWRFAVAGPAILAAAASVFFVVGRANHDDADHDAGHDDAVAHVVRAKGSAPRLLVKVAHDGVLRDVGSGDHVVAGDLLQFAVQSAGGHAGVVSVDGADVVSAYAPVGGALLRVGREAQSFDNAIQLDDVTGSERLVLFVCEAPTTIEALVTAVQLDHGAVPAGCAVDVVTLQKMASTVTAP